MRRVLKAISTPAARSSAFYYFGNFVLSFSRYLFHLILLRLLVPSVYGEFLSYLSLTYLLNIPMGTIGTIVTKFVSDYKGKGDNASISQFFFYLIKRLAPVVLVFGTLLMLLSTPLATLFKAHPTAFIVLGVSVFISLFQTIIGSYISAFQKFIFQTIVGFIGVVLTIVLAILFINLGMGATGAILGQILAGVITTILLFLSIKSSVLPVSHAPRNKFNLSGFTGYSFLYSLGTASLVSTDVLMARALFDSHTSGLYSALSILGRMILYGLMPFSALILPIAARRHSQNAPTHTVFLKLGAVIILFGIIGASIFSLFPEQIINLLSSSAYIEAAPLLSYFAFSMALLSFSQFIIVYLMATGRPQANIFLLVATILQPIIFYLFRFSFSDTVHANFGLNLALFVALLIYLYSRRIPRPKHI